MKRKFKTDIRLWARISVVLFILEWFLPLGGKNGYNPPCEMWVALVTHNYICPLSDMVLFLITLSVIFGAIAITIGWIFHCAFVIFRTKGNRISEENK